MIPAYKKKTNRGFITKGLLTITCLTFTPRVGAAQLAIGPVNLVLGMSKARAIQALREQAYSVDSTSGAGPAEQWNVTTEHPLKMIGAVYFTGSRLTGINRVWDPGADTSPVGAIRTVIGALMSLASSSHQRCNIEDWSGGEPSVDARDVAVVCGAHIIVIGLSRVGGGPEGFTIMELLRGGAH